MKTTFYTRIVFIVSIFIFNQNIYSQFAIVENINSGSLSSNPSNFTEFDGKLYFSATDGSNGKELWVYDGVNTTSMVADIRSGGSSSSPSFLVEFNGELFFVANNGTNGNELWSYDGSNSPALVADIMVGAGSSNPSDLTVFNGKLYFEALDFTNGYALWSYDGVNPPSMVADIHTGDPFAGLGINDLIVFNGELYFGADNETYGIELYSYDGVNAPSLVSDIYSGVTGAYPDGFIVFDNELYFNANDGSNGYELWSYDGTSSPSMVANINSGSSNSSPSDMTVFDNKLYFSATDASNGKELWEYDGTNSPSLVYNIRSGSASSSPADLVSYNGKLYFNAEDGSNGKELWEYDGTSNPEEVDDLYPGGLSSNPDDLTVFDGKLYMEASNGSTGFEFWSYLAASSCNCSSTSPIPSVAGTYTSSCSVEDESWKHFCDAAGNLLLSLEIGSTGAVVEDNQVSLKIENQATTYYNQDCGASPACFIDIADGAVTFNRFWDVNPTTQPSSGNVGVRSYFTNAEYIAVNEEIDNQGQDSLTSQDELWFYKVTNASLGQFPSIESIVSSDVQVIYNHSSIPTVDQWVLSTKTASSEYIAEFKVSSFSGGGGGGSARGTAPLPVELIHFQAYPLNNDIQLKWVTASEVNNHGFKIYRSNNQLEWELLSFISGNLNSSTLQNYYLLDTYPLIGINYYKLVQLDLDGKIENMGIRSAINDVDFKKINIYPNPVGNNLNIEGVKGDCKIYNSTGQLVLEYSLKEEFLNTIDVSSIPGGIFYIVVIQENGKRITDRFRITK
ncbi:MAG: T9SS type A sorting domain-containing protein [Saprospiraceae bacterium]